MEPNPQLKSGDANGTAAHGTASAPVATDSSASSSSASHNSTAGTGDAGPRASSASTAAAASASAASSDGAKSDEPTARPAPPARKSRSSSILKREHDKVWSEYFSDAINVTDVAAELTGAKPASAAADADTKTAEADRSARLAAARKSMIDIVGREQVTMRSTLTSRLGAIFDSYDKNNSGDMDVAELQHVLEDYLAESKQQMTKLSESLFAPDGELRKVLASSSKSDGDQSAELESMKQQFGVKMREKMARLEAVRAASADFAKQLLHELDRNEDGFVSRGEFMSAFQDKVEAIVDA